MSSILKNLFLVGTLCLLCPLCRYAFAESRPDTLITVTPIVDEVVKKYNLDVKVLDQDGNPVRIGVVQWLGKDIFEPIDEKGEVHFKNVEKGGVSLEAKFANFVIQKKVVVDGDSDTVKAFVSAPHKEIIAKSGNNYSWLWWLITGIVIWLGYRIYKKRDVLLGEMIITPTTKD